MKWKRPWARFLKTAAPCFRRILAWVIYQTCTAAWEHNSAVSQITHHTRGPVSSAFCVIREMLLCPLCIWSNMQMTERSVLLNSRFTPLSVLCSLCPPGSHGDVGSRQEPVEEEEIWSGVRAKINVRFIFFIIIFTVKLQLK